MCDRVYLDNLKDIDEIIYYLVEKYKSPLVNKAVNNSVTVYSGYKGQMLRIRLNLDKVWGFDDFIVNMKIAKYERYINWLIKNESYRFYVNKIGLGILKGKLMPLNVEDFYR